MLKDAVVLDMGDLAQQAQRMLATARLEAERIVEEATRRAEALIADAEPRGHAQGYERGVRQGRQHGEAEGRAVAALQHASQLAELSRNWSAALERWDAQLETMLHEARADVIRFAFALGSKI